MEIKVLDSLSKLKTLKNNLYPLLESSTTDTLHMTPEWMESWLSVIGRKDKIRFIAAFEAGQLIGLLPLVISKGPWVELGGNRIEFISGRRADYHDALVIAQRVMEITPKLLEEAIKLFDHTGFMIFHHIPDGSPILSIFRNTLVKHHLKVVQMVSKAPYLALEGNVSNLRTTWSKNHWKNLKWQRNRLQKLGTLQLRTYENQDEIIGKLPEFFQVHRESWLARGKKSLVGNDLATQEFLRSLVAAIGCKDQKKRIHYSTLDLNGESISYHYGFVYKETFHYYVPTYRYTYEEYSPGKVHLHLLIEYGLSNDLLKVFDFMVGDEPYKYTWTKTERKVYTLVASRGLSVGAVRRWWISNGKEKVRAYLDILMQLWNPIIRRRL